MIKLELPMEPLALKHAGEMLTSLAVSLGAEAAPVTVSGDGSGVVLPAISGLKDGHEAAMAGDDPPPPPPEGVELDAEGKGIPWDARIHGSGKTFYQSGDNAGCWKYKRGVDDATKALVEGELKAARDAAPPAPAATDTATPPPPPPEAGAAPIDFPTLLVKVTGLINGGRLTAEQATAEAVALGLPSYPLLATRPDLIPQFSTRLDVICPPTP